MKSKNNKASNNKTPKNNKLSNNSKLSNNNKLPINNKISKNLSNKDNITTKTLQKTELQKETEKHIKKIAENRQKNKEKAAMADISFPVFIATLLADFAAAFNPEGAKDAIATGDLVGQITKDVLEGIKHGDLHELNKHLKQPKFKKEIEEAKAGLQDIIKGAKTEGKILMHDGEVILGDVATVSEDVADEYGAFVGEVERILGPIGLDLEKLERMGCDEILGLMEISAACAEIMSFQKSAEVAMSDATKFANKANNMANQANAITQIVTGGGKIKKKNHKTKKKKYETKKKKYKKNKTKKKKH